MPTAGYLWFWYAVPFKRKLSLRSGGGITGLLPTKEAVDRVRRCGKSLRRKFELKQKDTHLRGGSGGLLKVHLKNSKLRFQQVYTGN